jgi:hypothetical protein
MSWQVRITEGLDACQTSVKRALSSWVYPSIVREKVHDGILAVVAVAELLFEGNPRNKTGLAAGHAVQPLSQPGVNGEGHGAVRQKQRGAQTSSR